MPAPKLRLKIPHLTIEAKGYPAVIAVAISAAIVFVGLLWVIGLRQ